LGKLGIQADAVAERLQHSETQRTLQDERLRASQDETGQLKQRLTDQEQRNRVLELILIKTELALENLRKDSSSTTEENPQPDQP
jgi:predicted nuclease with TOPRIM domain